MSASLTTGNAARRLARSWYAPRGELTPPHAHTLFSRAHARHVATKAKDANADVVADFCERLGMLRFQTAQFRGTAS